MTIVKKFRLLNFSFVILIISMVVFVISPLSQEIKKNSKELISQKEALLNLEAKIENLKEIKTSYQDFKEILVEIDNLLIDLEVPVNFISFLETTSQESQLEIKISPKPSKTDKKNLWTPLNFQINITGSFPNFLQFLERLENGSYLIEIQDLNISRLEEGGVKANFSLKIFAK